MRCHDPPPYPLSTLALYTADDIADGGAIWPADGGRRATRRTIRLLARGAGGIGSKDDTAWLAEMIDGVALPLVLPIGLPGAGAARGGRA